MNDSIGWASEEWKTKKPRFVRSGGLPKNKNPKIRKFVSFRGSGKGELRFGWLLKPRFVRPFGFRNINIFELKSTVSHFPDRIVSASLSRMIGSIIIIDANIHVLYI
ncbi:hypothetical protein RIR_jg33396.t2 [Rhizophagus irregularis DAOM 181602=DAOM 197198]|nr:hypothetical protein RIR_jg33396.t2 [Rhizophagus irregularis DAOM 181602=DAOM 197198]